MHKNGADKTTQAYVYRLRNISEDRQQKDSKELHAKMEALSETTKLMMSVLWLLLSRDQEISLTVL